MAILGQATTPAPPSGGVLPLWAELGLGGVLFGLILAKIIVPGWMYNEKKEERDKAYEENARRNNVFEEKVIPALLESASAVKESNELIMDLRHEQNRSR